MKKLMPIIIIAVVLIIAAVVVYMMFFNGAEKPIVYSYYSPGDSFVTNVDGSYRLFKTAVVLQMDTDKLADDLKEKNSLIRDTIIFILRELKEEDINSLGWQDTLRVRLTAALNERLEITNVASVLFSDYVMQ